jgi:LemA protein
MKRSTLIVFAVIVVFAIIALGVLTTIIGTRNHLVKLDEDVKAQWAQVENQLQRRYDLIPNLVETVKGFASQERQVFIQVTEARSRVAGAGSIPEKIQANNELSSALSRLLVVVENYPELKSNQNFMALQDELSGTENRIAQERRRYNETVNTYNKAVRVFPNNLIAGMFGFQRAELFEAPAEARTAPRVDFGGTGENR